MSVLAYGVAGLWVVGAAVAAFALMGPDRIQTLTLVEGAAIGAAVLFPALMAIFSGVAARDSARALDWSGVVERFEDELRSVVSPVSTGASVLPAMTAHTSPLR